MSAESALNERIEVAGQSFVIGPMSLYQLFLSKNLIAELVRAARERYAKRHGDRLVKSAAKSKEADIEKDIRQRIASRLGIDVEEIPEEQYIDGLKIWMEDDVNHQELEEGYAGRVGEILDFVLALSEQQIADIARIILSRDKKHEVTNAWIEKHFNLEWFIEMLVIFLDNNNLAGIIKNFQRLGTSLSSQASSQPTK